MSDSTKTEQKTERTTQDPRIALAFHKSVKEGHVRLERSWPNLLATGLVGGIDVSLGVLALLVIEEATGSRLLGALGFSIGFIALTLAQSELFTENFLIPVTAVVARKSGLLALLRLWVGTAVMNLVGGWIFTWLIINALPRLRETAIESARFYVELDVWRAFALGVIAGAAITLMTWMERGSRTEFGKIIAVVSAAFLLAATPLNHVIIVSLEIFAALHSGVPFGYADWIRVAALAMVANMVGGLLLVTVLRLIQVGGEKITEEQERPENASRNND